MHAYLGVTCHILIEWEIVSYLLDCWQILAAHTGENILAHFEEIVHNFQIRSKIIIFKAITDNASDMKKAFTPISLPGFVLADSDMNRQERAQRLGLIDSEVSDGPSTMKSKTADDSQCAPSCTEQEEYARNKAKLKQVYESTK